MKIFLRDRNQELVDAWKDVFKDEKDIHISCGDIFEEGEHLDVDAIVSPANSFGYMDGGIDFFYSSYFGWSIGDLLREKIWNENYGEVLVGQAVVIDMRKTEPKDPYTKRVERTPYLISAPTMRVPMDVSKTANAYLAFVATLRIAKENNFESILCPGLATAVGRMPYKVCANQMYEAYKHFENPRFYDMLGDAYKQHYEMLKSF